MVMVVVMMILNVITLTIFVKMFNDINGNRDNNSNNDSNNYEDDNDNDHDNVNNTKDVNYDNAITIKT